MLNDNIIVADNDDLIGYYKDLKAYLDKTLKLFIDNEQYEEVESMTELIQDLRPYSDCEHLLRISNNNGMGNTINMLVITDMKDIPF